MTAFILDVSNAEEVVTTNTGGLGESEVNGPTLEPGAEDGRQLFSDAGARPGYVKRARSSRLAGKACMRASNAMTKSRA